MTHDSYDSFTQSTHTTHQVTSCCTAYPSTTFLTFKIKFVLFSPENVRFAVTLHTRIKQHNIIWTSSLKTRMRATLSPGLSQLAAGQAPAQGCVEQSKWVAFTNSPLKKREGDEVEPRQSQLFEYLCVCFLVALKAALLRLRIVLGRVAGTCVCVCSVLRHQRFVISWRWRLWWHCSDITIGKKASVPQTPLKNKQPFILDTVYMWYCI